MTPDQPAGQETGRAPGAEAPPEILATALARIDLDGDRVAEDLARLVLGLVAFLHRVLELQAIRHLDEGTIPQDELDRVGLSLARSDAAIGEVAAKFGLRREDLSLDLGPLGRTI